MVPSADTAAGYAELQCLSNFTFLRGASHPHELIEQAHALGYAALAITDECSVAGVVRAHVAAKPLGFKLIVGSSFTLQCGTRLVLLSVNRRGYGQLCRLITRGRRAASKGSYQLTCSDVQELLQPLPGATTDCLAIWLPDDAAQSQQAQWLCELFAGALWLGVSLLCDGQDRSRRQQLTVLAAALGLDCVACGDVHMHARERRQLQDALTAVRHSVPLTQAGWRLHPNGERHLRAVAVLQRLYPPQWLQSSCDIAARCSFSLDELRYQYPREIVPEGHDAASWLRHLVWAGAAERWPQVVPDAVRVQIEHELALINELAYEPYFLTVHDVVRFARSVGILCQGRGSAANSVVCYCLAITSVDPVRMRMLFERFISRERAEPPDIDVDFEHERREEVIQYIYRKYGRDRAALTGVVISYRPRSALRDMAMVLGFEATTAAQLAAGLRWNKDGEPDSQRAGQYGIDLQDVAVQRLLALSMQVQGFPRHLSQHVGGFVIARDLLEELVPVENAAMPDRTVIQWDKDDLDDLGLVKVDVLALGMLAAIRRCFALVSGFSGEPSLTLASVPAEDPQVYDMLCRADSVGVFQIESRAQMAMLPRLRPRCYYDLVIEVAIVRPGPIQGDMVHPYLRRRGGLEPVSYPSAAVEGVLSRTLGIPIFQEQVMQLAIVAAGFSAGESDQLRRAMAAWKRRGGLGGFESRLIDGMRERGYDEGFARQIFNQIQGFGEYGFPESHAASFALLVYVSAWLKCHHPAAFTAALLNSLPMGFYAPAQLVRDARAHDVEVRAVDVTCSELDSTLEQRSDGAAALRLGLGLIKSLGDAAARRIVAARVQSAFMGVQDLGERAVLDRGELEALAAAGALAALGGHRHRAFWDVAGFRQALPTAPTPDDSAVVPLLRRPTEGQDIVADYASLGLTLGRHPVALLRQRLSAAGMVSAADLQTLPAGALLRVAGIVVNRQRPASASGVTFVTLEDETGNVSVIVWRRVGEQQRLALLESRLLEVRGQLQREAGVIHLVAQRLIDRSRLLGHLMPASRDFR
ncbi:MAG: error-prone DNA polymerase [Proteobacteria bacterium]|nr:error-prone DNA polymerase [Pseudomonadota bacterium]